MNEIIMAILAIGAVIGGVDYMIGNKLGLGSKFEEGFMLLGPTGFSMAGVICLAPLLAAGLRSAIAPLYLKLGLDPGMLGGILAIDMGGYQLSQQLATNSAVGNFSGVMVAATFGCTISFSIPVGMGLLDDSKRRDYAKGIMIGLGTLPIVLLIGGLLCGLSFWDTLYNSLPIIVIAVFLMIVIERWQEKAIQGFLLFAKLIRGLATIGLIVGAFVYMTKIEVPFEMTPVEDAMVVVSAIGIVLLGSLPTAELLQRGLRKPISWLGRKLGTNDAGISGLLISCVSAVAVIAVMKDMDAKGRVINGAFLVSATSMLAAHLGFTFGVDASMVGPLMAVKAIGGIVSILAVFVIMNRHDTEVKDQER